MGDPESHRIYRVDQSYRDSTNLAENQFYHWLGVKNSGGIRPRRAANGKLAFLILVSSHIRVATYNPWDDVIDPLQGRIWYWGDAKAHESKRRDDWDGNACLQEVWEAVNEQHWSDVPPVLHFSKLQKGWVHFNGVCVLADLRDAWMEDQGKRVRNYRCLFEMMPLQDVPIAWLHSRVQGPEMFIPEAWKRYQNGGQYTRLVTFAKRIRTKEEQLPLVGTAERQLLNDLNKIDPFEFERLVVRAFQKTDISHEITQTRHIVDGGFDFFGSFRLPPPLAYTIPLKGEVKRYSPDGNAVGPKDVARLVARLQRGEHGLFVTTSAFTKQAQEEVFSDQYPVELLSGGRLAGLLAQVGAVRAGRLQRDWLE